MSWLESGHNRGEVVVDDGDRRALRSGLRVGLVCRPRARCSRYTRENVSAVFDNLRDRTRAASRHFSVLQFADMKGFDVFERTDFVPAD